MTIIQSGFKTIPITMEAIWLMTYQAPAEDVDRVFDEIRKLTPLQQGKTDSNAYRAPGGIEYYRPLEGTPTGTQETVRKRPGVDEVRFSIPRDDNVLTKIIEAIYAVHSYYEPVITVQEILRSSCNGLDDQDNPHRWWNKGGDWMTANG